MKAPKDSNLPANHDYFIAATNAVLSSLEVGESSWNVKRALNTAHKNVKERSQHRLIQRCSNCFIL